MATIEDQIRELRTAISTVQGKKARAAVELDNAKDRLAEARRVLKSEFGVETTEDAKEKLEALRAELDDAVSGIESLLQEAGA